MPKITMYTKIRLIISVFCLLSLQAVAQPKVRIPAAGNAWVSPNVFDSHQVISRQGITQWQKPDQTIDFYFYAPKTGKIKLWLTSKVNNGSSTIATIFEGHYHTIKLSGSSFQEVFVGEYELIKKGYQKLTIKGLSKASSSYAQISHLVLQFVNPTQPLSVLHVKNDFHFGRRGPSVHLAYTLPPQKNIRWFYNEILVPRTQDVQGSYFMAIGFQQGYFGIQVNSPTERRVLFSVWSPYKTDNPQTIPPEYRVKLLNKGKGVHTGKFGNEGSGGQSYKVFDWQAGIKYRFLLKGEPSGNQTTIFTAYFFDPVKKHWHLIASFQRPKTNTYLKGYYSFLENFIEDTGAQSRQVYFGNQWIGDTAGNWHELTQAKFTVDATARKNARKDYTGGVSGGYFYLKNCGFFNPDKAPNVLLKRAATHHRPMLQLDALPKH
ncbi:DUF3472 domain-containing protein [Microscilla marina]|uniref:DUF5077 domain-containing protein n=1 Tax=Microscilla marina ATCC 23134 TaxID=313606 RepID=A1ZNE3_MICM2|nr:DUF3472 domain-containing protein [Microscilla marina]EAY28054.1 conserved hypothetical protein [Microscilla marina ATCC 23134]